MNKTKILVVDDEEKIVEVIESYMLHSGYEVIKAYNGKEALMLFKKEMPALVILDLMLPDISGETVCQQIRKSSKTPVIMLTAKASETDILQGFDFGADDYVVKPFSPKQLLARVLAVLKRTLENTETASDQLSFCENDLILNVNNREVYKQNKLVKLTPIEFNLLVTFTSYPNKIFTRDELIATVLGEDFDGYDRAIDSHIKNLRQKIETDAKNPKYVLTVFGIGYRFNNEFK